MATFSIIDKETKEHVEIELTSEELSLFFGSDEDWFTMCDMVFKRTGQIIIGNELHELDGRPIH